MPAIIAAFALLGFFGVLSVMAFEELPPNAVQPFSIMLGVLGGLVAQIGNYYFGSSAGSARKNEIIENLKKTGHSGPDR